MPYHLDEPHSNTASKIHFGGSPCNSSRKQKHHHTAVNCGRVRGTCNRIFHVSVRKGTVSVVSDRLSCLNSIHIDAYRAVDGVTDALQRINF